MPILDDIIQSIPETKPEETEDKVETPPQGEKKIGHAFCKKFEEEFGPRKS